MTLSKIMFCVLSISFMFFFPFFNINPIVMLLLFVFLLLCFFFFRNYWLRVCVVAVVLISINYNTHIKIIRICTSFSWRVLVVPRQLKLPHRRHFLNLSVNFMKYKKKHNCIINLNCFVLILFVHILRTYLC